MNSKIEKAPRAYDAAKAREVRKKFPEVWAKIEALYEETKHVVVPERTKG